uniref:formyltransferase family protein n=1 Tax=Nocardia abscessus TaxID=120957 RepID=UPI00245447F0
MRRLRPRGGGGRGGGGRRPGGRPARGGARAAARGAAPVQAAIDAGDEITGASSFQIEAGLDTGPVFGMVTEKIAVTDTAGTLLRRLADSGSRLL